MIKKPLIAGIMLVVAHTAGAAQVDDTNLQQIYTEAGIQGICSAGMLAVPEGARDEVVRRTSDTSRFSVPISTSSSCAGVPAFRLRHLATGVTAMRSLICRLTVSDALWLSAWRDFRAQLASAYLAPAEKGTGKEAVPAGTKPGTEHGSAAD